MISIRVNILNNVYFDSSLCVNCQFVNESLGGFFYSCINYLYDKDINL